MVLLIDESYKAPNRLAQVSMFRFLLSEILQMIQQLDNIKVQPGAEILPPPPPKKKQHAKRPVTGGVLLIDFDQSMICDMQIIIMSYEKYRSY